MLLYMKTFDHISLVFPRNKKMFRTKFVAKIKTHFMLNNFFFKFVPFMR